MKAMKEARGGRQRGRLSRVVNSAETFQTARSRPGCGGRETRERRKNNSRRDRRLRGQTKALHQLQRLCLLGADASVRVVDLDAKL